MHKKKILLGTSNQGKIKEFLFYINHFKILEDYKLLTLDDLEKMNDPIESSKSFCGNSNIKSKYYFEKTGLFCLSDDSGFIVDNIKNYPGVKTARLAKSLGGINNAVGHIFKKGGFGLKIPVTFYCCLSLSTKNKNISASGKIRGELIRAPLGDNGFGYDPYFIPKGFKKTYAELDKKEKMLNSHRYFAFDKLEGLLKNN